VAAYWESVVKINDWQKARFSGRIVRDLFNTVSGKHIGILGFAFKKDTNDTRETAAIAVCRDLLAEGARVVVYDPQVSEEQIRADVLGTGANPNLVVVNNAMEACRGAHAVAVLTEWDEFKDLDFKKIHEGMLKPAFLFDGATNATLALDVAASTATVAAPAWGSAVFAVTSTRNLSWAADVAPPHVTRNGLMSQVFVETAFESAAPTVVPMP
jgi:hypothetical protein